MFSAQHITNYHLSSLHLSDRILNIGGCYRCGYMTGIFYDEDMQSVYHATGSSILTL